MTWSGGDSAEAARVLGNVGTVVEAEIIVAEA